MEASAQRDVERRLTSLENVVVPRRETELIANSLDRRITSIENAQKWAFRMIAAAFIGFLFQGIIVLATLKAGA